MRVRAIDGNNDWTFGRGRNNYKKDLSAVVQIINTKLKSFLGDCFFDLAAGIDWFNLNSQKNVDEVKKAISSTLINIPEVTKVIEVFVTLGQNRVFTIQYSVDTIYGVLTEEEVTQEV